MVQDFPVWALDELRILSVGLTAGALTVYNEVAMRYPYDTADTLTATTAISHSTGRSVRGGSDLQVLPGLPKEFHPHSADWSGTFNGASEGTLLAKPLLKLEEDSPGRRDLSRLSGPPKNGIGGVGDGFRRQEAAGYETADCGGSGRQRSLDCHGGHRSILKLDRFSVLRKSGRWLAHTKVQVAKLCWKLVRRD
ncbi:hypothetical protein NDN08_007773 [Rhodosorus marinus]|uniref:Uncharacterized protein n=1 Tax=Rhodosorus marinus TaxID=101924 RepID=A0AAV8UYU2_9RHOD|nr:hypothetical protein NDN08_007773 [Rhodosorus marinus]